MTTIGQSTIRTAVLNKIKEYTNSNLNRFNSTFEYSRLVSSIDNADKSIISNDTSIRVRKETKFVHNFDNVYELNFYSPIVPSNSRDTNVISSAFRIAQYPDNDLYITDDNGVAKAFYLLNNIRTYIADVIGTVDYTVGKIKISMKTINVADTLFSITVLPLNKNILPSRNSILTLNETDVSINVIAQ